MGADRQSTKDQWTVWARIYMATEYLALGSVLDQARAQSLSSLQGCRRVLLLGDGDGRFLARLCCSGFTGEIVSIDGSEAMIRCAQQRLRQQAPAVENQVTWLCADIHTAALPAGPFDGIVSQFFLDNFSPGTVSELIRRVKAVSSPDAVWSLADFVEPQHLQGWRRVRQQLLLSTLYSIFRYTAKIEARQLPPIEALMRESGWRRERLWQSHGSVVSAADWRSR